MKPAALFVIHVGLLLALLASVAAASSVLVVDQANGPGTDYKDLQVAIDSAGNGDLLLVRSGNYVSHTPPLINGGPLVVDDKALTIQADTHANVTLAMGLQVLALAPDRSVLLRDLTVGCDASLVIHGCAGPVWCDNLTVLGFCLGFAGTFTEITDSDQVFLDRCTLHGGSSIFGLSTDANNAVTATNSAVHAYDCQIIGGASDISSPSGHGYKLLGGSLMVSGGTLQGGGPSLNVPCGGPGLWLAGNNPKVWMRDTTVIGGEGGCVPALRIDSGTVTTLAGNARGYATNSPLRPGDASMIQVTGDPGDQLFLFLSLGQSAFFKPSFHGTLQLGPPLLGPIAFGALPASGQLDLSFPVGAPPAGVDGFAVYSQPFLLATGGQIQIAGGSAQVFLDGNL